MKSGTPEPRTNLGGDLLLQLFVSFPIACLTCALITDVIYVRTANVLWADFSAWLLAIGFIGGLLAAVMGVITLALNRRVYRARTVFPVMLGSLVVLAIALLNNLVHSRDGWTAVMPTGLALSLVTVLVIFITVWFASDLRQQRWKAEPSLRVRQ